MSGNIFGPQTQTLTREKEQEKVVQGSVQQELDNTIYELPGPPKPELGGLLNLLGVEASDILEHLNTLIKNKRKMLSLNKSRKIIILMILKMPLIFSMVEKIVISIKQLNFYPRVMKIENLLHFYCLIRDRIQ